MKLLDRLVWSLIVGPVALLLVESALPRLLPTLVVLFVLVICGRGVWYVTRR